MTTAICARPWADIIGLIIEDASKVVAVGKYLVLRRQIGASRVDKVDAGQAILRGDLLSPQMFLHASWGNRRRPSRSRHWRRSCTRAHRRDRFPRRLPRRQPCRRTSHAPRIFRSRERARADRSTRRYGRAPTFCRAPRGAPALRRRRRRGLVHSSVSSSVTSPIIAAWFSVYSGEETSIEDLITATGFSHASQ